MARSVSLLQGLDRQLNKLTLHSLNARLFVLKDINNTSNSLDTNALRRSSDRYDLLSHLNTVMNLYSIRFEMRPFRPGPLSPPGNRTGVFDIKVTTEYQADGYHFSSSPEIHGKSEQPFTMQRGAV